jgi:hypothetical protein
MSAFGGEAEVGRAAESAASVENVEGFGCRPVATTRRAEHLFSLGGPFGSIYRHPLKGYGFYMPEPRAPGFAPHQGRSCGLQVW